MQSLPGTPDAAGFSISQTLDKAKALVPEFLNRIQGITYENKGILFSEMLFLYATCDNRRPLQIIESGRARAQSTLILSKCFQDSHIVSMERYRETEDAEIAERRLQGQINVSLLFGDSMRVLPHILLQGDLVLIDGPKRFRAVRLALQMLATGKPDAVFIHDTHKGFPERKFLEKRVPGTFFSDHEEYVMTFRKLDDPCWETIEANRISKMRPYSYDGKPRESYGPTLTCVPRIPGVSYKRLVAELQLHNFLSRISGSKHK